MRDGSGLGTVVAAPATGAGPAASAASAARVPPTTAVVIATASPSVPKVRRPRRPVPVALTAAALRTAFPPFLSLLPGRSPLVVVLSPVGDGPRGGPPRTTRPVPACPGRSPRHCPDRSPCRPAGC